MVRDPDLADAIERLARRRRGPFYAGDIGAAVSDWVLERGGTLSRTDLHAYSTLPREPVHVRYHGREVLTNPPPSAGGLLIAYALALLERGGGPAGAALVAAMEAAQTERTGVPRPPARARVRGHVHGLAARLHDARLACSTPTAGPAASRPPTARAPGSWSPGTGIHVNNMMGEQDLSPAGWFTHPPGRRLPSMMAPTIVLEEGRPELVVGSAGSNRIRSAILQVIVNAIDHGLDAQPAVDAARLHFEDGLVYAEPGVADIARARPMVRFRERNLFFGGCQAAERHHGTGSFSGGGDPRRGGAVVRA